MHWNQDNLVSNKYKENETMQISFTTKLETINTIEVTQLINICFVKYADMHRKVQENVILKRTYLLLYV